MSADLLLLLYHKFGKSQRLFAHFAQFRYVVIIQNIFFVYFIQNNSHGHFLHKINKIRITVKYVENGQVFVPEFYIDINRLRS